MRIAMANDHAGYSAEVGDQGASSTASGHEVVDFGTHDENACDLPDFAYPAALAVGRGEVDRGIFVDGVGYGSAMIANKIHGVFAAVCQDPFCAELARSHSNTNALCLGGKIIGSAIALEIVRVWMDDRLPRAPGARAATRSTAGGWTRSSLIDARGLRELADGAPEASARLMRRARLHRGAGGAPRADRRVRRPAPRIGPSRGRHCGRRGSSPAGSSSETPIAEHDVAPRCQLDGPRTEFVDSGRTNPERACRRPSTTAVINRRIGRPPAAAASPVRSAASRCQPGRPDGAPAGGPAARCRWPTCATSPSATGASTESDHTGELVVAASVADDSRRRSSGTCTTIGYPIASMRLVDDFGGSDDASMAANNTSAFNCRPVTGGGGFSEHSYGTAIDLNPVQNPYLSGSTVLPAAGPAVRAIGRRCARA